jgi:hypothetical protein
MVVEKFKTAHIKTKILNFSTPPIFYAYGFIN